jgi:toxin ParE1/3/4
VTSTRYLLPAIQELERAVDRYAERSPRVAAAFFDSVRKAVGQLEAFPESAPILEPPIRRLIVQAYPFSVLYYLKDETVVIVAIMHHRQEPGCWRDRLR